jgi:hypothetical protein
MIVTSVSSIASCSTAAICSIGSRNRNMIRSGWNTHTSGVRYSYDDLGRRSSQSATTVQSPYSAPAPCSAARTTTSDFAASGLPGALADDVGGRFVVAHPEKTRLTQPAVLRPLREADLGNQLRASPVRAAGDGTRVDER